MEDLLDTEIGKNDYDWLLTPPGTPRVPALDVPDRAASSNTSKHTVTRSSSTIRTSRLSTSEPKNGHHTFTTTPARSNSVSRLSNQSTLVSSNNMSSILNSSNSSVSSRPTTPSKRTSTRTVSKPSSCSVPARPSTPSKTLLPTLSKTRPSTPVNTRPVSSSVTSTAVPKITSAPSSRSATPTSRTRIMSTSSSSTTRMTRPNSSSGKIHAITRTTSSTSTIPSVSRSSSRSSTPTRQTVKHSSTPSVGRSPSVGRISGRNSLMSNGRPLASSGRNSAPSSAPSSRPSSPNTRSRAPVRPLDIPDFPSETPPNLRTKLPERLLSAGRVRPVTGSGVRSTLNVEPLSSAPVKKMTVPAITRSKISGVPLRTSSLTNGHRNRPSEGSVSEDQLARTLRSATVTDNGFGRTISRNSLDMAMKHMGIRQNLGGIRGASLFPHSIRSTTAKGQPAQAPDSGNSVSNGDRYYTDNGSSNGHFSGDSNGALSHHGGSSIGSPDRESVAAKEVLSEMDIYANSRYEVMLLREDTKNTNWLHSVDDISDHSTVFDHRFEALPEPFGPL